MVTWGNGRETTKYANWARRRGAEEATGQLTSGPRTGGGAWSKEHRAWTWVRGGKKKKCNLASASVIKCDF